MKHLLRVCILHRDIKAKNPLISRHTHSDLRSVHSVSHTLDGLRLFASCWLISSCNHVRDCLFKGFPRKLAAAVHHNRVPSCRLPAFPTALIAENRAGSARPPTGLCSNLRSVATDRYFTSAGTRSPLKFSHLWVFLEHLGTTFATPPLMTFTADSSSDFSVWPLAYQSMLNRLLLSPASLPHP